MTREEKILFNLKKDGMGVEIGASHAPITPKKAGYNVHVIDHGTREELMEKYRNHPVNLDNIEEVDFIWNGEDYAELTGKTGFYDWIIASHVIEHTPNLVGFLNSCETILKDDGVLSLAIPDVRFCFDYFRPETGLSKVLDAHFQNQIRHSIGSIAENYLNHTSRGDLGTWNEFTFDKNDYVLKISAEETARAMENAGISDEYVDCHNWCFTPSLFRLVIMDLNEFGLIKLKESAFFDSAGCEFYIHLSKSGSGCSATRLELLQQNKLEHLNAADPDDLLRIGFRRWKEKMRLKLRKSKQLLRKSLQINRGA